MGLGGLLIQPRLVERRDAIGDEIVLTASEVKALPERKLVVVLDRSAGFSLSIASSGDGAQRSALCAGFE